MLNSETKKHIDAARQVLVGVAPNPMTQIDQITFALIYKFMDDMDKAAIKAGGTASFFTGELEPFAWQLLMDSRLGNQEKMEMYASALEKFSEARQLPELFRTIFRSAFLPYRSPETLGLFLKEISYFDYSHPEELGNAYEYLLSIMSAQGDAGQFRTPRHIIDFMVQVIEPEKTDKVLDPACGTGGFLVASYNYILEQHDGRGNLSTPKKELTPDDRKNMMINFEGYDIDPSMVRIAQVNMYLHLFKNPRIFQYDSLTNEDRWNDKFDVILANPPFMTPKGGIRPHSKFGISSNRSEVLFVDYISSHLKPNGRAAIIVPEGILFQKGTAYKQLRSSLLERGLYAVVSLPQGVFNPYSGVKTSILFINREVAKVKNDILFITVNDDGFSLGSTRQPVERNDLPQALSQLQNWTNGKKIDSNQTRVLSIKDLLADPSRSLDVPNNDKPKPVGNSIRTAKIGEIVSTVRPPKKIPSSEVEPVGMFPVIDQSVEAIAGYSSDLEAVIYPSRPYLIFGDHTQALKIIDFPFIQGADGIKILDFDEDVLAKYAFYLLKHRPMPSAGYRRHYSLLKEYEIPICSLEDQKSLVTELDQYFAVIDGAKKVIRNWVPKLEVSESYELVRLGEVVKIDKLQGNYEGLPFVGLEDIEPKTGRFIGPSTPRKVKSSTYKFGRNHVLLGQLRPYLNKYLVPDFEGHCSTEIQPLLPGPSLRREFLAYWLSTRSGQIDATSYGARMPRARIDVVLEMEIPLPNLEEQENIIRHLRSEQAMISGLRDLISSYEKRAEKSISAIWSR